MLRNVTLLCAIAALAACAGDPLRDVPRLGDVDVAEEAPVAEAMAAPEESDEQAGFFSRILRKRQVGPSTGAEDSAGADAAALPEQEGEAGTASEESSAVPEPEAEPEPERRGFRLFGRANRPAEAEMPEAPDPAGQAEAPDAEKTDQTARRGLFGTARKPARRGGHGVDAREALPGETLPFGEVARACHLKRGDLGTLVAKYPERGGKYKVYDSAPGNLGLHSFYLTGFRDGCPRQVTAALAVFGSPGMYEALRYGLPVKARSKKPTDTAYEKVKSRLCGVSRNKPCGAKLSRIEKDTVFLSLYNRFEGAQGWTTLLISDGEVLAKDIEG